VRRDFRLHPLPRDRAGRRGSLIETLRRLEGEDRLAAAALVVGLFAYVVHGVVDFDWDFIAVTAPAVAVLGVLLAAGRPAHMRLGARRGVFAVAAGAFAAAALYSLASRGLRLGASTTPTQP